MRNAAAALVAIACWAGLAIQFSVTYGNQHHIIPTLWVLARFFTIHLGWMQTWLNAGGIVLAFLIAGLALVWIAIVGGRLGQSARVAKATVR